MQQSNWDCVVERTGTIRLGLRYVTGLRKGVGHAIEAAVPSTLPAQAGQHDARSEQPLVCPKCGSEDSSMMEIVEDGLDRRGFCSTCAHDWRWRDGDMTTRFRSLDDLVARTGVRRDELATLAEIGALNSFGYDRRTALWQIEWAVKKGGELFKESGVRSQESGVRSQESGVRSQESGVRRRAGGGTAALDEAGGADDRRLSGDRSDGRSPSDRVPTERAGDARGGARR